MTIRDFLLRTFGVGAPKSSVLISAGVNVGVPTNCVGAFMIQPGPRAVTHVACRPAYLRVHFNDLRVEDPSTTECWAWASTNTGQISQGGHA